MKRKSWFVLSILLVFTLNACSINQADAGNDDKGYEYKLPDVGKDFVKIFADDADYTFGEDNSYKNMLFTIVSSYQISEEDEITVTFDPYVSCDVSVDMVCSDVLPYEIFEAYQGEAWTLYAEETGCDLLDLRYIYNEHLDEMPVLYKTTLAVKPNISMYKDKQISSMTISLNGKETTYDFSNLIFSTSKVENKNATFLVNDTLALSDLTYQKIMEDDSESRIYSLENLVFTAADSVKIKRVYFWNHEEIEIQEISVQSKAMTYRWDGKEALELIKDEAVTLDIAVLDDAAMKYASFNRVLVVEYEAKGETYNICIDVSLRIRDNAFKMLDEEGVL